MLKLDNFKKFQNFTTESRSFSNETIDPKNNCLKIIQIFMPKLRLFFHSCHRLRKSLHPSLILRPKLGDCLAPFGCSNRIYVQSQKIVQHHSDVQIVFTYKARSLFSTLRMFRSYLRPKLEDCLAPFGCPNRIYTQSQKIAQQPSEVKIVFT